jgi:hypothetical protein
MAECVLVEHQLLILNRSRRRSPNLHPSDGAVAGLCAFVVHPGRFIRSAIVLKPSGGLLDDRRDGFSHLTSAR